MELPQPSRPYAGEGRKAIHDFLSLYGHSPVQQDPRPSSHGGYLKTHNFLQPLEKEGKCKVKEDSNTDGINVEKPPLSAPSPVEQVFPKGIEYRINHVSYFNPRMPKTEGTSFNVATAVSNNDRNDENSNVSSYTAGSTPFTLWDESSSRKGKTGKENLDDLNFTKEPVARTGQWPIERPSESSSNHPNNFRSRSSSQPPEHKNQSFVQMLIAGKLPHAKEEDEDDVFTLREDNPQRGELRIKVDGRASNEQKANTPRSKHSATEQRRRCKINDRFQTLRKIIPNSDQKRDKASFLLEVIEYIQFLQEKVSRYEGYPGCSSEPKKSTPWTSSPELAGHFADQPGAVNGQVLMFTPDDMNNINTSNFQRKQQNPAEPATDNPIPLKAMDEVTNSTSLIPLPRLPEDIFPSLQNNVVTQPACPAQDADDVSRMQQLWQSRPHSSEFITDTSNQEKAANGGSISISNKYSQGLLNALTQALMSSGVDVSQASISVQVDIGKQTNPAQNAHKASMDFDINCDSLETRQLEESNCTTKRLKTLKS